MAAKDIAEAAGVKIGEVARAANITVRGLGSMAHANPDRLDMLCKGQLVRELGLTPEQMKAAKILLRGSEK